MTPTLKKFIEEKDSPLLYMFSLGSQQKWQAKNNNRLCADLASPKYYGNNMDIDGDWYCSAVEM